MCRQAGAETARVDDQGTSVPSLTQRPPSRDKRRGGGRFLLAYTPLGVSRAGWGA